VFKEEFKSNASLPRGNLPESGREVGENLIAETSACPFITGMPCKNKGRISKLTSG
jgi:hypothetical protein